MTDRFSHYIHLLYRNILSRSDANHIINKHSKSGQNALYFAAKFGNLNAVRFLLEQQADPHIKSYVILILLGVNQS